MRTKRGVVMANPSFDVYGADLQLLQSVRALLAADWSVTVVAPAPGPLQPRLQALGAGTEVVPFPVVRRADASARGVARLAADAARSLPSLVSAVRRHEAAVVYVNTVTVPWWLSAARLARRPSLVHVHEAEPDVSRAVATAMSAPLLLAGRVVVNSRVSGEALHRAMPRLRTRTTVLYNGVPGPADQPSAPAFAAGTTRLVSVGRLSARKAPHTTLEAVALLRGRGHDVRLEVVGTPVAGQEAYADRLRRRADKPDLAGAVTFAGYLNPIWPALARADAFVSTSTAEPFGNAVVEAQLARRPVVVTAVEGHLETVEHGRTGLHVPVGDSAAVADAVERLLRDPDTARGLATAGRRHATAKFGTATYDERLRVLVATLTGGAVLR